MSPALSSVSTPIIAGRGMQPPESGKAIFFGQSLNFRAEENGQK